MLKKLKRLFQWISSFLLDREANVWTPRELHLGRCIVRQVALSNSLDFKAMVLKEDRKIRIGIDKKNKDSYLIKLWKNRIDNLLHLKDETQSIRITSPYQHSMGGLLFHRVWPYYHDDEEVILRLEPTELGEIWCSLN